MTSATFTLPARVLHWLMAVLIVAMLFIGVGMVASVSARHAWLLAIHKPLGIAILILAIVRLAVRLRHPPPPLPADLPALQKLAALASHWLLYFLMLAMPLIGWAMLSAGGYPVMLGTRCGCRRSSRPTPSRSRCCAICTAGSRCCCS